MPELRWILIAFGVALLIGIYVWGRRTGKAAAADAEKPRMTPAFEPTSYEEFEPPLVAPLEDVEAEVVAEEPVEVAPVRDVRSGRIEPTLQDEGVTAELPVREPEPIEEPVRAPAADAPTLSMSNTPPPRRIERRKIIALRLAAGLQRLNGAQLKAALDAEGLQHGKYDVFHRHDEQGTPIFSIASMVEPGTFNLETMPRENFPGITLFTQLPAPVAGMLAFNELIACSRRLHAALGGTLQDERGVPLTVHRIERIRQEIREFEHRPTSDPQRSSSSYSTQ